MISSPCYSEYDYKYKIQHKTSSRRISKVCFSTDLQSNILIFDRELDIDYRGISDDNNHYSVSFNRDTKHLGNILSNESHAIRRVEKIHTVENFGYSALIPK